MKKPAVFIVSLFIIAYSCTKKNIDSPASKGQIEFAVSTPLVKSALQSTSDTLSTDTTNNSLLTSAIITIEDGSGNVVQNDVKIDIYNMNGDYISQPLSLVTGTYTLTKFLLVDQFNKVIYAAPLKSSSKAYLVTNPLPITFSIQTDNVTKVVPEVISTNGSNPEDFGYVSFGFDVASTFNFLLGTFIYNDSVKNYEMTTASLAVYSDTSLIYSSSLKASSDSMGITSPYDSIGITNKITLPEKYSSLTLAISKPGYETYRQTFSTSDLKQYFRSADKGPLVVVLNKVNLQDGLVAWYKFNSDVMDYSEYKNNATIYGTPFYTNGKDNNANSALSLNGTTDYLSVQNNNAINCSSAITVYARIKSQDFFGSGNDAIVDKPYTSHTSPFYQFHLGIGGTYDSPPYRFGFNLSINHQYKGVGGYNWSGAWIPGNWYDVVGTYDGAIMKLYVNGNPVDSVSIQGKTDIYNTNLYFGRTFNTNYYVPITIDAIRIYNRALSQDEIKELYQQ